METRTTEKRRTFRQIPKARDCRGNIARIYMGNLSFDATRRRSVRALQRGRLGPERRDRFQQAYTEIEGIRFMQMQSIDEAKRAVAELHDKDYMGRKLVVSGAKALEEKRGERRQPE